MTTCKSCGAPLDGPLAIIAKIMGVKPSEIAPGYCNKCEDMALARKRVGTAGKLKIKRKAAKKPKKRTSKKKK